MSKEVHSELSGCWWWRNRFEGLHYDACCVVVICLNVFKSPLLNPQLCFYLHRLYYRTQKHFRIFSYSKLPPLSQLSVGNERTDCWLVSAQSILLCSCWSMHLLPRRPFEIFVHQFCVTWNIIVIYDRCFSLLLPFFFFQCYVCFEKCWARSWKMAHGKVVPVHLVIN